MAITTLCLEGCEVECGGCVGDLRRCCMAPDGGVRGLLVVSDDRPALLGNFTGSGITAIFTEQPLVVSLVMRDIDAKYGHGADENTRKILNQAMHDVARALKAKNVKLASLR